MSKKAKNRGLMNVQMIDQGTGEYRLSKTVISYDNCAVNSNLASRLKLLLNKDEVNHSWKIEKTSEIQDVLSLP